MYFLAITGPDITNYNIAIVSKSSRMQQDRIWQLRDTARLSYVKLGYSKIAIVQKYQNSDTWLVCANPSSAPLD